MNLVALPGRAASPSNFRGSGLSFKVHRFRKTLTHNSKSQGSRLSKFQSLCGTVRLATCSILKVSRFAKVVAGASEFESFDKL